MLPGPASFWVREHYITISECLQVLEFDLDGEAFAAFGAAGRKNLAAADSRHARAEAVPAASYYLTRLPCALHFENPFLIYWILRSSRRTTEQRGRIIKAKPWGVKVLFES